MQRLIDAALIGAERAAALEDQHDLMPVRLRMRGRLGTLAASGSTVTGSCTSIPSVIASSLHVAFALSARSIRHRPVAPRR